MRGLKWIAGALALLATAAAAGPPAATIAERRAGMHRAGVIMRDLRNDILAGRDVAGLASQAQQVVDWAGQLTTLFPPGSEPGDSKAQATIWTDRAGFEAKARAMGEQARRMVSAAEHGDRTDFAKTYRATAAACGQCHLYFRQR